MLSVERPMATDIVTQARRAGDGRRAAPIQQTVAKVKLASVAPRPTIREAGEFASLTAR